MSFITNQGLALAILSIALAMPRLAKALSYEAEIKVPKPSSRCIRCLLMLSASRVMGQITARSADCSAVTRART
jgi:hypothetical protein